MLGQVSKGINGKTNILDMFIEGFDQHKIERTVIAV